MATYIYIPKSYTISGQSALVATISSPLTYKSQQVNATHTTSVAGFICAYGQGNNLLGGATTSSVKEKLNAWCKGVSDNQAAMNGRIIHMAPCERYEFDNLANEDFKPLEFGVDVTYHNSISGTGQFIGRSVVRKRRKVKINVLSYASTVSKMSQVKTILEAMIGAPFYVQTPLPEGGNQCVYGWIEQTPTVEYLTDYGQASLSFEMVSTL